MFAILWCKLGGTLFKVLIPRSQCIRRDSEVDAAQCGCVYVADRARPNDELPNRAQHLELASSANIDQRVPSQQAGCGINVVEVVT